MPAALYFTDLPPWAQAEIRRSHYRKELVLEEAIRINGNDWRLLGEFTPHGDRLANAAAASSREHRALFDCFLRSCQPS